MSLKKNVAKSVGDLIDSGLADNQPGNLSVPVMKVNDIWPVYKHLFKQKTRDDMLFRKSNHLIYQYNDVEGNDAPAVGLVETLTKLDLNPFHKDRNMLFPNKRSLSDLINKLELVITRKLFITGYLGVIVEDNNFDECASVMAELIDHLSDKNFVKGHLCLFNEIPLYDGRSMMVSYLLFDDDGIKYLKDNKLYIDEGGLPKSVEDIKCFMKSLKPKT